MSIPPTHASAVRATVTDAAVIAIDPDRTGHTISPRLFGLFFEDINFGLDGGLNANLVVNHSFEAVYLDRHHHNFMPGAVLFHRKPKRLVDRARHWIVTGGELEVRSDDAIASHGHYAHVSTGSEVTLTNHGYPGSKPGMGARDGVDLEFRAHLRPGSFVGAMTVCLVDSAGTIVAASEVTIPPGSGWRHVKATLRPSRTALTAMQIVASGVGAFDVDEVSLIPVDHWASGDPRWSQGKLRRDLVETIAAANPAFLRFPGGCIVEGLAPDNTYDWKKTVGPIAQRQGDYSLWGLHRPAGDYYQSHQIGFYEFFLLCEDLGIEAIPVVPAGVCCQIMANESLEIDSPEFAQLTQDILDLIDWATADPGTNTWAALRAEAGHPEPFRLDTIGIGNENFGDVFLDRFDRLRTAIVAYRPDIDIILSGSPGSQGRRYDKIWKHASQFGPALIVDEHFYASQKWFTRSADRYDSYDRSGPRVFVGEYAAQFPNITTPRDRRKPANMFASALAEAAFYTGIIRNSDVVAMTSYAPLLNLVEEGQWSHNFIDFNPFTVQPTMNYEMQKFFTDALGDRTVLVPDLPTGILGSVSRTDDRLFLHLVNQTNAPIAVRLDVAGDVRGIVARDLHAEPGARHALAFADTTASALAPTVVPTSSGGGTTLILTASSVCAVTVSLGRPAPLHSIFNESARNA